MSYREVQLANSKNRVLLTKPDQQWLKKSGYKNVGWDKVILLYQKIEELIQEQDYLNDLSLGELFLEADRIGNKYLTPEEIADNNQKLAEVNNRINEQIDQAFPDTEDEVIDFGNKAVHKYQTKPRNKKF
ncbi:MAG: hypothetical protein LH649_10465 [Pseudanabaena sp. CAN_BIN31]|nr:hypothetical protein [Pseudanabaena sp. CAN_BIN31]